MYHILFVDDDRNILRVNKTYFEEHDYNVSIADNIEDAVLMVKEHDFDCIVLDIILSKADDGYELCRRIQQENNVPVIFLSSLTEKEFVYRGFKVGGEDYMTKPYDLHELMLRVESRISRYRGTSINDNVISLPPLKLNLVSRNATVNGEPLSLTAIEYSILALLCSKPGIPFSPGEIYTSVWKLPDINAVHTVHSHIGRLRAKLDALSPEHHLIQTEWGKGYVLVKYSDEN